MQDHNCNAECKMEMAPTIIGPGYRIPTMCTTTFSAVRTLLVITTHYPRSFHTTCAVSVQMR